MGFAARTLVEALPGPAAIVDQDGLVLVANTRWIEPPEGAHLNHPAMREVRPGAAPLALDGLQVTYLESDCGAHRRLVTAATAAEPEVAAAAKSRFLALLGHEIRTPVTTVVAAVDLLRAQPLELETREIVDGVHHSVHALKNLTDDLLDLARLEAGRLQLERVPTSLRAVLEGVVEPLQETARRKGLLLLATPAPDLPGAVLGDIDRLRQVLTNVVGNAVKFTEAGEVVVTAAPDGPDAYVITVSDTGPGIGDADRERIFAPFVQADSSSARRHEGAGLGLALAARLVERMGGVIDVRSRPGEGSEFEIRLPLEAAPAQPEATTPPLARRRIALVAPTPRSALALSWLLAGAGAEAVSITRAELTAPPRQVDTVLWCDDTHDPAAAGRYDAIAEAAGPQRRVLMISLTDPRTGLVRKPGVLSAPLMRGRLVAALNQERTGVRGAPITVPNLAGGRVLLAEDNDVNRTVFRRMIELLGVECDTVPDGGAAVTALLGEKAYDVVLMDLQMPVTDGLTATRQVRAAGCRTPILALTATALHGDRERCLEAGMDGHLSKPITLPELRAALAPYLTGPDPDPPGNPQLRELEEQLADRDLVMSTVSTYLAQLDGRRQALADGLRDGDHAAVRSAAHTLKSSSALLGATALAEACLKAERGATAETSPDELSALVAGVEATVDDAVRMLTEYIGTGVPA